MIVRAGVSVIWLFQIRRRVPQNHRLERQQGRQEGRNEGVGSTGRQDPQVVQTMQRMGKGQQAHGPVATVVMTLEGDKGRRRIYQIIIKI